VFRWTCPPAGKKIDETDWERIDGFVAHLACSFDGSLLAAGPDTNLYFHQVRHVSPYHYHVVYQCLHSYWGERD
jgi:hypothetical protein